MEIQEDYNQHPVSVFKTIKMYPDKIKHIHCSLKRLCITRENYSEIYNIVYHKDKIFFDEMIRLEKCEYLMEVAGSLVMVKSFEVRMFNWQSWKTFPFSAEMRTISLKAGTLYSHHLNGECRRWDPEEFTFSIVAGRETPFHISNDGIKGYSRSIKGSFTSICQRPEYLYLGDSQGTLHVYETKYLTQVTKIKKHQGPILSIIENNGCVYLTGCDSKIVCVKEANGKFAVSSDSRGQSHDVLSLCFIDEETIVSGGLSTDICYYRLENGNFAGKPVNRPSLPSKKLISSDNAKNMIAVNQQTHFQIWKYNIGRGETDFLLKFESKQVIQEFQLDFGGKWVAYSTVDELVVMRIDQQLNLTKRMTFKPAIFMRFIRNKSKLLVVTRDTKVYVLDLIKSKEKFILQVNSLSIPSDFDFKYPRLILGSKLEQKVSVIDLVKKEQNTFETEFHFLQLNAKGVFVSRDNAIDLYLDGEPRMLSVSIPLRRVRFGGTLPDTPKISFFFGQGLLLFVKHLTTKNAKYFSDPTVQVRKKMITQQIPRVYQSVLSPHSLGIIGIDYVEMLEQIDNPIISKKIF